MTAPRAPRERETDEVIQSIRRQVRSLEGKVAEEDPWALAEVVALRDELDAIATRTVNRLRAAGYTWNDIGLNLRISGKTAQMRYSRKNGA